MIKYVKQDTQVTFAEIPTEISLCINLSLCPHHCKGCHSQYLQTDCGDELTEDIIDSLLERHSGITCVVFMGGDNDKQRLSQLAKYIKDKGIHTGWYSGEDSLNINNYTNSFTYIKIGSYQKEYGPLNYKTTNPRLYRINNDNSIEDITYMFWR